MISLYPEGPNTPTGRIFVPDPCEMQGGGRRPSPRKQDPIGGKLSANGRIRQPVGHGGDTHEGKMSRTVQGRHQSQDIRVIPHHRKKPHDPVSGHMHTIHENGGAVSYENASGIFMRRACCEMHHYCFHIKRVGVRISSLLQGRGARSRQEPSAGRARPSSVLGSRTEGALPRSGQSGRPSPAG